MRVAIAVLAAALVHAAPASACTVAMPYKPLSSVPPSTARTSIVDIVAVSVDRLQGTVVSVQVVRPIRGSDRPGARLTLPYVLSVCGETREPRKGERLVMYFGSAGVLGWATLAEARRFDPRLR